ncbi:MAG: diacylglycerol kinase, partial [Solirubrobacteraceae bacterium]
MTVRRTWSAIALVLVLAAIVLAVDTAIAHFPSGLAVLACLILAGCCAWLGICRRGAARIAGLVAAALFVAGAIVLVIVEARVLEDALVVAAILVALAATREAFKAHAHLPRAERPSRPV